MCISLCIFCIALSFQLQLASCSARSWFASGNHALVEDVGRLVKDGARLMAAGTNQNNNIDSLSRGAFLDSLQKRRMTLVNENVSEIVERANRAAVNDAVVHDDTFCSFNWRADCPDGWQRYDEHVCKAPPNYAGACATLQALSKMDVVAKRAWSSACSAPWPCRDACELGHDYDGLCPLGWVQTSDGICHGPESDDPRCPEVFKFDDMHVQQKQSLTVLCNISWPCRTACSRNFSAVCPEEWLEHPLGHGVCTAPDSYAGNCASVVSTTHMSHVQKHEFALRCSIAFPCDDIARVPHIEKDPIQNGAVERDGGQRRDDAMTTTEQPRSAKFLKRFAMRPGPIPTYASNSI